MNKTNNIDMKKISARSIALILIGAGIQIGFTYIMAAVFNIIPQDNEVMSDYNQAYDALTSMKPYMITYVCIVSPLLEEAVFRLGILGIGKRTIPIPIILIAQALLFGIYHGNVVQAVYGFVIGILFGIIYIYLGGYLASTATHMSVNILGIYLVPYLPSFSTPIMFAIGGIIVAVVIIAMVGMIRYREN